ncbi:hypothetical protein LAWASA_3243 [Lawsonibacter asaccharolyticus]|nr:hypothetical protein LAWASA_3243 [Lawsonibacter asaccharolyticus]
MPFYRNFSLSSPDFFIGLPEKMTELFLQVIYLSDSIRFPVSCFISGILDICKNKLLQ